MAEALYNIGDFVEFVERPVVTISIPKLWYMLRLHPNYDLKAERQLHERGITAYVPKEKLKVRSVWHRVVERTVPIFPGAMFVPDFDADIAKLKRSAEGIGGFVKCAGEALRISLADMTKLRQFEARRSQGRKFSVGERIRIISGPFDMLEGSVDRVDPRYRIRVLIEVLGGRSPVELDEDQVEAV